MNRIPILAVAFALACMVWTDARAQSGTDWGQGVLSASGFGVPPSNLTNPGQRKAMAVRAAKVDAQRNLVEMLQGVNVDAETTVENAMASDIVRTRVRGVLRGAQVVDTRYHDDGTVEVTLAVNLRGSLSDAILPEQGFAAPAPETPAAPAPETSVPEAQEPSGHTGLVVDARDLGLAPALAPKIVDEKDNLVYGAKLVSREAAVQNGIVAYGKDLDTAREDGRIGGNPLVIKGIKAIGRNKTNVVVSAADAEQVLAAAKGKAFLSQCKVIIVSQ